MFSSARMQLAGVLVRRDARRIEPHVLRVMLAAWLWFMIWQFAHQSWRGAAGHDLLVSLTFASAVGMIAAASRCFDIHFGDEWTGPDLELLRMTGLSGLDLLIAQSMPHLLTAVSWVLVQLPFALVTITLGGVTLTQIAAVAVELAVLFAIIAGCAVFTHALLANSRIKKTIMAAMLFLAMGLYFLVTMIADNVMYDLFWSGTPAVIIRVGTVPSSDTPWLNPISESRRILSSGYRGYLVNWTLLAHGVAVAGLFVAAGRFLNATWLSTMTEEEPAATPPGEIEPLPLWRPVQTPPRCTDRPIEWKEYYFTLSGPELTLGKWGTLLLLSPLFFLLVFTVDRSDRAWLVMFGMVTLLLTVASIAWTASRLWQTEFRERTLWGLAMLPRSPEDIVFAKLAALARVSRPEIAVLTVATLLPLWFGSILGVALIGGVFASLPLVVCTDTGWRFIEPRGWEGHMAQAKLLGVVIAMWSLAGMIGYFVHPLGGLVSLIGTVPFGCRLAIDEAAKWFAWRAGEISEK